MDKFYCTKCFYLTSDDVPPEECPICHSPFLYFDPIVKNEKQFIPEYWNDYLDKKTSKTNCSHLMYNILSSNTFIEKQNKHIQNLLSNEYDYEFTPNSWTFDDNIDNKTMLDNLAQEILKHTSDIYIRNNNFLGFPTIRLYIPGFSSAILALRPRMAARKHKNVILSHRRRISILRTSAPMMGILRFA